MIFIDFIKTNCIFIFRFKDGKEIKSDAHYQISNIHDNYTLLINNASVNDAAVYKFAAKNEHGNTSCEVRLDCHTPPKILKGLNNLTVTEHDKNVEFLLHIEAFPKPTIRW